MRGNALSVLSVWKRLNKNSLKDATSISITIIKIRYRELRWFMGKEASMGVALEGTMQMLAIILIQTWWMITLQLANCTLMLVEQATIEITIKLGTITMGILMHLNPRPLQAPTFNTRETFRTYIEDRSRYRIRIRMACTRSNLIGTIETWMCRIIRCKLARSCSLLYRLIQLVKSTMGYSQDAISAIVRCMYSPLATVRLKIDKEILARHRWTQLCLSR